MCQGHSKQNIYYIIKIIYIFLIYIYRYVGSWEEKKVCMALNTDGINLYFRSYTNDGV